MVILHVWRGGCRLTHKSSVKHVCHHRYPTVPLSRSCPRGNSQHHARTSQWPWSFGQVIQFPGDTFHRRWSNWVLAVKGWIDFKSHLESIAWARWANSRDDDPWNEGADNCLHRAASSSLHLAKQGGKGRRGFTTEEKWNPALKIYTVTYICRKETILT